MDNLIYQENIYKRDRRKKESKEGVESAKYCSRINEIYNSTI